MKNLLIGISAPTNAATREAISVIAEEFNLEHFNLRQPAINMVAAITNMHPTHQEFACEQNQVIDDLGISIAELELMLSFNLRITNPRFFIERTNNLLQESMKGMNGELFDGSVISGVKTEVEAQWIRDQGGLVVHLYQYDNKVDFHALHEKDKDLVCNISSTTPTRNNMPGTIAAIKARINQSQQAA